MGCEISKPTLNEDEEERELPPCDYEGGCGCGAVRFTYAFSDEAKPIFNSICHCQNCRRMNGTSPHLMAIPGSAFSISQGEECMKCYDITEGFQRTYCEKCGVGIYQGPKGANFVASYPATFDVVNQQFPKDVPEIFQVKAQTNCENSWAKVFEGEEIGVRLPQY
jgi:hypothetical protein